MNKSIYIALSVLLTVLLLSSFFSPEDKPTIWMMGDSTMAIKDPGKFPETGWGVAFAKVFQSQVKVDNRARNGRSTKSFINEGLWKQVQDSLKSGDYVFIQFGHNDEKVHKPAVGTQIPEFKKNFAYFVKEVRKAGGTPVLLSPIARRIFENGDLKDTHGEYPGAIKTVADSLQVAFIDLTTLTTQLLTEAGEEGSKSFFLHLAAGHPNYPKGVTDNTHLNEHGAKVITELVVKELKRQRLPIASLLKD